VPQLAAGLEDVLALEEFRLRLTRWLDPHLGELSSDEVVLVEA
jgi:hypothetical protein